MSDGYTKNIPTIKGGISAAGFAVKENCLEFYSETNHASLPSKEGSGMSDEEKDALKRHLLSISLPTIACQGNITIMSYVEESKHATDWLSGKLHLIVIDINERYKD
ncbi:hypothetical protein FRACYDRAFT_252800 [Fragilariopsis cylindrus CCMP1102]|uniref:Uncharacterized protein n=1 Tax=Fragilariopsis cylindrus CCMP1102 TaxID=635003 RepID=A0A1E7ELW1_9STRA|nr:hypothetical protein FRACYDRAFT_252800 [Fragilariopsis cylindrus CCMP1102]|eukprot:OEU06875.1 hypothetical protein FRACYDRAFT_252800 [Fragilariopsis cylindrus CCMP1102]